MRKVVSDKRDTPIGGKRERGSRRALKRVEMEDEGLGRCGWVQSGQSPASIRGRQIKKVNKGN